MKYINKVPWLLVASLGCFVLAFLDSWFWRKGEATGLSLHGWLFLIYHKLEKNDSNTAEK